MPRKLVRLRDRNQITLPDFVVENWELKAGDFLEFLVHGDHVEVHPARIAKAGTPEAAEREAKALGHVQEGKYITFDNVPALQEHLAKRAAAVQKFYDPEHGVAEVGEIPESDKVAASSLHELLRELEKMQREAESVHRLASRLAVEHTADRQKGKTAPSRVDFKSGD
jgi:bifunctional DNA-binding transcriptional regulator/antitoxin component of YhaV-PrlF toxin-antitoxin module